MIYPSEKEFLSLSRRGNLIPVYKEIVADLETPVSAYLQIARNAKYSFLLESVEGEEKIARYSFLAKDPELVIRSKGKNLEIAYLKNGKQRTETCRITDTPLSHIREIMSQYKFVNIPGLPRFCGGLVGYLGYDVVRFFERLPDQPKDDLKLPDVLFILAKDLVIFDHINHKMKIVSSVQVDPNATVNQKKAAYRRATQQIDKTVAE